MVKIKAELVALIVQQEIRFHVSFWLKNNREKFEFGAIYFNQNPLHFSHTETALSKRLRKSTYWSSALNFSKSNNRLSFPTFNTICLMNI